jgi:hypothetical protein
LLEWKIFNFIRRHYWSHGLWNWLWSGLLLEGLCGLLKVLHWLLEVLCRLLITTLISGLLWCAILATTKELELIGNDLCGKVFLSVTLPLAAA